MVLVFQQLCHKAREMVPVKNKLFLKDMHFKGFPLSILRWVLFFYFEKMSVFGNNIEEVCG